MDKKKEKRVFDLNELSHKLPPLNSSFRILCSIFIIQFVLSTKIKSQFNFGQYNMEVENDSIVFS